MDVLQDISNWTRDEKIRYLNALSEDEDWSVDAFPVLETLLNDEDPEVRRLAVAGLWDYPKPQMIDRLFDLVLHDPSQDVRSKAVVTLGRYIYEGTIENFRDSDLGWMETVSAEIKADDLSKQEFLQVRDFLVSLISDERQPFDTRRFAIEAVSFLNEPDIRTIIAQAYDQPDLKMKVSAVFAMGRCGDRAWWDILLKELQSPIRELRFEATRAAGEAYLAEASPILMELAESDDLDLKLEALWSLGKTGGPGVRRFLSQARRSKNADVREIAGAALEELDLNEALDEDLGDDDEDMDDFDEEEEDDED